MQSQIIYTVTREAFVTYNLYYAMRLPAIRRVLLLGQFVPPLLVALFCTVLYVANLISAVMACLMVAVMYATFTFLYPMIFRNMIKKRVTEVIDREPDAGMLGDHLMQVQADGLRDSVSGRVVAVPYSQVRKVVENAGHLYVFFGEMAAFLIPFEALGGKTGAKNFLTFLKARAENAHGTVAGR